MSFELLSVFVLCLLKSVGTLKYGHKGLAGAVELPSPPRDRWHFLLAPDTALRGEHRVRGFGFGFPCWSVSGYLPGQAAKLRMTDVTFHPKMRSALGSNDISAQELIQALTVRYKAKQIIKNLPSPQIRC